MERFLRASLLLYLLATALGLLLRYALVRPVPLEWGNSLHAHSHTLYFGWAGLALFTFFFDRVGARDRVVQAVLWGVVAMSVATFGIFLRYGYAPPGIVISSLSLVVWGAAVVVFWRRARGLRDLDVTFLRIASVYVGLAGLSAGGRVVITVLQVTDPLPGLLAVFGFLHCFAAFFAFGVMGLLTRFMERHGAPLDPRRLRLVLGLMTPLSVFTFPLGVPGGMESVLGPPARLAAALLVIPNVLWLTSLWPQTKKLEGAARQAVRIICGAWAVKSALELAGAAGLADLASSARHPAVLYLHLMLLGIVTASLLLLVRERFGRSSGWPLLLHQAGVAVMLTGLAAAGVPAMLQLTWPMAPGLWLGAAGGLVVVAAGLWATIDVFRAADASGPAG